MKFLFTIVLFVSCLTYVSAQDAGTSDVRRFSKDKLDNYRSNPDYQYDKEIKVREADATGNNGSVNNSNRSGRVRNGSGAGSGSVGTRGTNGSVSYQEGPGLSALWYIILGVGVVGLAFLLVTSGRGGSRRAKKVLEDDEDELGDLEDISLVDIDGLLTKTTTVKDYRKATRLHYLQVLQKLSEKKIIHWQLDKTNRDYYYEIKDPELQRKFEEVTLVYEYVWYGDVSPDEANYARIEKEFSQFLNSVR